MDKNMLSLSWGLFNVPFFRNPTIWLGDVKIYFKRVVFLLRHGYPEQMLWQTSDCFMSLFKDIFDWYLHERTGDIIIEGCPDANISEQNDKFFASLIQDLRKMEFDDIDDNEEREKAKNHFFENFSKYFFQLWD